MKKKDDDLKKQNLILLDLKKAQTLDGKGEDQPKIVINQQELKAEAQVNEEKHKLLAQRRREGRSKSRGRGARAEADGLEADILDAIGEGEDYSEVGSNAYGSESDYTDSYED